jgi:DNA-binding SARP family transcriptional activator/type II secretory pathway pseudopilin PulG
VLALLLLHANEVVRTERLIDDLWGERAPRNAAAALHTHVSRLRKALGPDLVVRREWGYVLRTHPESFDLSRFERLVADAEPLPAAERSLKLVEALQLWRGPALADLGGEGGLEGEIARLEELHLAILERRVDADLEAGRNAELVGEIEALVAAHPVREHLRWQLILALYRAGRQVEALEVYRETRRVLTEELGLEPSPELRELERAILRQDPALALPAVVEPNRAQPPPTRRRRRLYLALVVVLLLGALAAIAALLATQGTGAAKQVASSTARIATQTTTTTIASNAHRTVHHAHTAIVARHAVHPANKTGPARTSTTAAAPSSPSEQSSTHTSHGAAIPTTKKSPAPTTTSEPTKLIRIADGFSDPAVDPLTWTVWNAGSGGTAAEQNGELVFSLPANPTYDSPIPSVGDQRRHEMHLSQ